MPPRTRPIEQATVPKETKAYMLSKKQKAALADARAQQHHHHHHGRNVSNGNTSGGSAVAAPVAPTTNGSSSNSGRMNNHLDLDVIDDAFGKTADLYVDVLQVPATATQEEIQLAYFDRRSELFTKLAKIDAKPQSDALAAQRYKAERKMDSVVLAVRVLGDPTLRVAYDRLRPERIHPNKSGGSRSSSSSRQQQRTQRGAADVVGPAVVTPTMGSGESGMMGGFSSSPVVEYVIADVEVAPIARERRKMKESKAAVSPTTTDSQPIPLSSRSWSAKWNKKKKKKSKILAEDSRNPSRGGNVPASFEDDVTDEEDAPPRTPIRRKNGPRVIEASSTLESRQEDDSRTMAETLDTVSTAGKDDEVEKETGVFSCITASRAFKKMANEISGACEDTLVSVDQVFNAFTLTDKDIKAVTKKIDKVKRQLDS